MVDDEQLQALLRHTRRSEDERLADLLARALTRALQERAAAERALAERVLTALCVLLGLDDDGG